MKLMEKILSQENLEMAIRKVKQNKGAPGIDRMTVQEIEYWFEKYQDELIVNSKIKITKKVGIIITSFGNEKLS